MLKSTGLRTKCWDTPLHNLPICRHNVLGMCSGYGCSPSCKSTWSVTIHTILFYFICLKKLSISILYNNCVFNVYKYLEMALKVILDCVMWKFAYKQLFQFMIIGSIIKL